MVGRHAQERELPRCAVLAHQGDGQPLLDGKHISSAALGDKLRARADGGRVGQPIELAAAMNDAELRRSDRDAVPGHSRVEIDDHQGQGRGKIILQPRAGLRGIADGRQQTDQPHSDERQRLNDMKSKVCQHGNVPAALFRIL